MEREVYEKYLETCESVDQFFHWRDGSWHPVDPVAWAAWGNFVKPWAPLLHVGEGEHYFVCCTIENGRLYNIKPHRYRVDATGRSVGSWHFEALTPPEIERFETLNRRHYEYPQKHPLGKEETEDFERLRDRLWRSWLPPAEAMRELLRVINAQPEPGDAAWHALTASGLISPLARPAAIQ